MTKLANQNVNKKLTSWISFELIIFLLFFSIQYLPQFESFDPMGPQWLSLGILNVLIFTYIHFFGEKYLFQLHSLFRNKVTLIYLVYILWAVLSILYAFNKTETWINISRLLVTFISFIHFSVLLSSNKQVIIPISIAIAIIVFGESIYNLNKFISGVKTSDIDSTILSLSGSSGNKNIYAASLLFKLPFIIYAILILKTNHKIILSIVFTLGVTLLFLVNARSTFVGFVLVILLLIFYLYINKNSFLSFLKRFFYILFPIIIGLFFTTFLIDYARETRNLLGGSANSQYSAPLERVKDITINKSGRNSLWQDGINYIFDNPLFGVGYGNWKIFSSRGDRDNEYFIPYHVHNDFIEITTELGLIGGILFLGIFFFIAFPNLKLFFIKSDKVNNDPIHLLILMLLSCYLIDAFFNFPIERPVMQIYFSLLVAFAVTFYQSTTQNKNKIKSLYFYYKLFCVVSLINILFTTYNNYKSLVMQNVLNAYGEQKIPEDVLNKYYTTYKPIPNLNFAAQPIDAILAKYYTKINKTDIAIELLERSKNDNPNLFINEYFLGYIYAIQNNLDSAYKYNKISFYGRPRNSGAYSNLTVSCMQFKDSIELDKAFNYLVKLRDEPYVWYHYLGAKFEIGGRKSTNIMKELVDSALKKHPNIDSNYNLNNIRSLIYGTIENKNFFVENASISYQNNKVIVKGDFSKNTLNYLNLYKDSASNAFMIANYKEAIRLFKIASKLDANNYAYYENIGVCYFTVNDFVNADKYFSISLNKGAMSGKSELYKALCLIQLGNKAAGCPLLYRSKEKRFTEVNVDEQIAIYCK